MRLPWPRGVVVGLVMDQWSRAQGSSQWAQGCRAQVAVSGKA
jgi:hypothetical protein